MVHNKQVRLKVREHIKKHHEQAKKSAKAQKKLMPTEEIQKNERIEEKAGGKDE